jgi:hypothetical protein
MRLRSLILFCGAALPLHGFADTPADFSGTWVVGSGGDAQKAESSVTEPPQHGSHAGGMGGHGGHGGHGGMGGHHGGHSGPDSNGASAAAIGPAPNPRLHAHTLVIRQSEVVFDIAADGQRQVYRFDNRNNYGAQYGGTVTLNWTSPEMTVDTHPDGGGDIVERYTLSPDSQHLQLSISTQRLGSDAASEVKRQFDRDSGAASAP